MLSQCVFLIALLSFETHVSCHRGSAGAGNRLNREKLLFILVDGVRWDYLDEDPGLKGFKRMADNGVRAPYVTPVYPTNSYPNWYSLTTGLYPESHGFVNNMMYDSIYDDFFLMGPNETASVAHWWNSAEPLWITAEKNEKKSALFWWDGCQVEIRGWKPSRCVPYKYVGNSWSTVNSETQDALETALDLFDSEEAQLVQVYYEPVDYYGHKHGPDSEERKQALKSIDSIMNWLQLEISNRGLQDEINIVVASDHGMTWTDTRNLNVILLEEFVDISDIRYMVYYGANSMILPQEGREEKLYSDLKKIKGLNVYKKAEIPEHYHLKNNRLTLPILIVAEKDYFVKGLDIPGKSIPTGSSIPLGSHGYDPQSVPEMRGIFLARGPSFKRRFISEPLEIIDIYNVMCAALGIDPLLNNGSWTRTKLFFSDDHVAAANLTSINLLIAFATVALWIYIYR